jgi:hypothetical protein
VDRTSGAKRHGILAMVFLDQHDAMKIAQGNEGVILHQPTDPQNKQSCAVEGKN